MIRIAAIAICLLARSAMASVCTIDDLAGTARAETASHRSFPLERGMELENGTLVATGRGSRLEMKFRDGLTVILGENTAFRIDDYVYVRNAPVKDKVSLTLLKGSLRVITGLIGKLKPDAFILKTNTATLGVRGSDFIATSGSHYLEALKGQVFVTNSSGRTFLGSGQIGYIPNSESSPTLVERLPAEVAFEFAQLSPTASGAEK
ncbi:MAG: FecR domain-containing protein [Burkholderiales bacterium]|nr:FecR domain-containing protein [Burkholderiales bacterium]